MTQGSQKRVYDFFAHAVEKNARLVFELLMNQLGRKRSLTQGIETRVLLV